MPTRSELTSNGWSMLSDGGSNLRVQLWQKGDDLAFYDRVDQKLFVARDDEPTDDHVLEALSRDAADRDSFNQLLTDLGDLTAPQRQAARKPRDRRMRASKEISDPSK